MYHAEEMIAVLKSKSPNRVALALRNGQEVIEKDVTFDQFLKVVNGCRDNFGSGARIGRLPYGFVDGKIGENEVSAIIQIPAGNYAFQYQGAGFVVPFPSLVFAFRAVSGNLCFDRCFATPEERITEATMLYHYPFSNVYEDGRICFGNNTIPECQTLADFEKVVNFFYGAPSNGDLWRKPHTGNKYEAFRFFLEDLMKKEAFPTDLLEPAFITVEELMNAI